MREYGGTANRSAVSLASLACRLRWWVLSYLSNSVRILNPICPRCPRCLELSLSLFSGCCSNGALCAVPIALQEPASQ